MLPISTPKGGSQSEFVIFVNKNQLKSNKLCYKVFCVKTSGGKVVAQPFPNQTVYNTMAANITIEPNI